MRSTKPKLLFVIGTLAHMGGAERQALYLVEHLSKLSGCSVELLAFEEGAVLRPRLEALGVPVHVHPYYFRWRRWKRLRSLVRLAWRLRFQIKPDALLPYVAIHCKTIAEVWPYSGARFCWWNQRDEGRGLFRSRREAKLLNSVSCVISNSLIGRDFLVETYGIEKDKVLIQNNGIACPAIGVNSEIWRKRLEIEGRQIVTMVANIDHYKDHDTLLNAWSKVRHHYRKKSKPVLLLAGYSSVEKILSLKQRAFDLGMDNSDIKFLGAVEDVENLIAASDLLVHSSLTEGCPNAICEAMVQGRAVVATDIPGARQALGEQGSGWLVSPRDSCNFADRIIQLLENKELRDLVGENNRNRVEREFSIVSMTSFYQRLIENGLSCRFEKLNSQPI